ncbi:MAG: hypothetical protein U1A78_00125 [Polyangia bacterium]
MDLFYRGYDPDARITSAAKHVSAAASRLAVAMVRSIPKLPDAAWQAFQELLTVDALWSLALVIAGWLIATVIGGVVGLAVNALLVLYGLIELWDQIKAVWGSLERWAMTAYEARSEADLDLAGQHFATALSVGGITILEVLVTHRVFRAVEGKLRQRFPTPEWLRTQYDEAARQRETQRKRPQEVFEKAAETVASGVRGEGMKRAAEDFPTAAVVAGGVLLGVGTVVTLAWAASAQNGKARP